MSLSPSPAAPVGLIGIGLLGTVLAERLVASGFQVVGFDLDASRVADFGRLGGAAVESAGEVLRRADRVLLSLPSHREVEALLLAEAAALRAGLTVIDTTTGDPASAQALATACAARGAVYLDATISGSSAQLREGVAIMMVGGDDRVFAANADLFAGLGTQTFHTGGPGTGARMKLVTNVVLGLNRAALAEGLALARGLGLNAAQALAIMRGGPAYSRIMDRKGEKMLRGDFVPEARLSQHLKDVRLIVECGRSAGLPMPLSVAHQAVLEAAEAAGLGALDNSAIIQVLSVRPPADDAGSRPRP